MQVFCVDRRTHLPKRNGVVVVAIDKSKEEECTDRPTRMVQHAGNEVQTAAGGYQDNGLVDPVHGCSRLADTLGK